MHLQVWLPAFLLVTQIRCAHNITVDNTDPSIIYSDALWRLDSNSTHYNGTLVFSEDNNAKATFTFTGVAVYYRSSLFTDSTLSVDISVDSGVSRRVNVTKPIGAPNEFAQPLWATIDPTNEVHVVVISLPKGGQYIVVNGFIVTVLDADDLWATLSSSSAIAPRSTSKSHIARGSVILVSGIHAGGSLVVIIAVVIVKNTRRPKCLLRRRRKPRLSDFWD